MNHKGRLYINGKDAWETYSAVAGKDFVSAMLTPPPMKPLVENSSRLEDGKHVDGVPRFDTREVTLTFNIHSSQENGAVLRAFIFIEELKKTTKATIKVILPHVKGGSSTIRFYYEGEFVYKKSTTYRLNARRTICTIAVKLEQPTPHMDIQHEINPDMFGDTYEFAAIAEDGFASFQPSEPTPNKQEQS